VWVCDLLDWCGWSGWYCRGGVCSQAWDVEKEHGKLLACTHTNELYNRVNALHHHTICLLHCVNTNLLTWTQVWPRLAGFFVVVFDVFLHLARRFWNHTWWEDQSIIVNCMYFDELKHILMWEVAWGLKGIVHFW